MNQKRKNKSNQEKLTKNSKIITCRYLTQPVFRNPTCEEFIKIFTKKRIINVGIANFLINQIETVTK